MECPLFEVLNLVRISIYKKSFAKGYTPNWSEEDFSIKKVKILSRGHTLLVILTVKRLLAHFTKKNYKKQSKIRLE